MIMLARGAIALLFVLLLPFFLLLPVAGTAASPVGPERVEVPYRKDYAGWIVAPVMVNGRGPYDFIIDTGATTTVVFQNLATEQGFPLLDLPPQRVLGTSSDDRFPVHAVGAVSLGGLTLENLTTVVLPDWRFGDRSPHGVIGLDMLSGRRLGFDADRKVLTIEPSVGRPALVAGKGWGEARMRLTDFGVAAGGLYVVESRMNSRPIPLYLDTGATGVIINGPAIASILDLGLTLRIRPSGGDAAARVQDSLADVSKGKRVTMRSIRIARTNWHLTEIVAYDAPIFRDLGMATRPFGLLGAGLLIDRSFVLDFPAETIWIGPKARERTQARPDRRTEPSGA